MCAETHLANRCVRGKHITIKCVRECIPPTDTLPKDACRNAYHQQMHTGMHTSNRCVRECFSQTDTCGNTSFHQQIHHQYHQQMRCTGIHLPNRCVWEHILQTYAFENASHQTTDACGSIPLTDVCGNTSCQLRVQEHISYQPIDACGNTYSHILPTDACWNTSHQEDRTELFFGPLTC